MVLTFRARNAHAAQAVQNRITRRTTTPRTTTTATVDRPIFIVDRLISAESRAQAAESRLSEIRNNVSTLHTLLSAFQDRVTRAFQQSTPAGERARATGIPDPADMDIEAVTSVAGEIERRAVVPVTGRQMSVRMRGRRGGRGGVAGRS